LRWRVSNYDNLGIGLDTTEDFWQI
jgi:hypothetical protein